MFGLNEIVGKKWFREKPQTTENKLFVTSMFMTLQGEGPYRGEPAFFIRLAKCNLDCSFCFPQNTMIQMFDGKRKKIKDVKIGNKVVAWDENSQQFVEGEVSQTFKRQTDKLIKINLTSGQPTFCTPEHPFLVKGKGWVEAQHLLAGDTLLHFSNSDRMQMFNPMFNAESKAKTTISLQTMDNRVRASNAMRDRFDTHPTMRQNLINKMSSEDNPMKNPATAAKAYQSREDRGRKTGVEKRFEIITAGLPVEFVGNGSLVIQHKFPDFVVPGQKKVIEVWAADAQHAAQRDDEWKTKRADLFAKEGYETLFVSIPPGSHADVNAIRQEVSEFIHNGEIVSSIETIAKGSGPAWTRFAGSKFAGTDVYNFEVKDYHTYVANGKIVHNCDTFFDDGDWLTFDQIEQRVESAIEQFYADKGVARPSWTRHSQDTSVGAADWFNGPTKKRMVLVMTGGEPMLQDNMGPFLERMSEIFQKTQIESNGTQATWIPESTTLVCSPKCLEKNKVAIKYLEPRKEILERADCLKFVMSADLDSPYSNVPEWAHAWAQRTGKPVFCSPMNIYNDVPAASKKQRALNNGITLEERSTVDEVISFWEKGLLNMDENQKNHEYTAMYCVTYGFILNLQIHLLASLA